MALLTECPSKKELEKLLKPSISNEHSQDLLNHLEACPSCWETIGPLLESDTLLRDVSAGQSSIPPDLFGRLLNLRPSDATGEFGPMSATPVDVVDPQLNETIQVPSTIGHYQIVRLLGKGGMGVVYLATDTRLSRPVALKIMLPRFAASPSAKERFLREARAAAQIANDNVVTIYEADERDGIPYIAMQYLQGASLDQHLRAKESLSVDQILRIAEETATGLAAAHAIGLVHRDIKPGNLWLESPSGRVKVLDFGLAKPVDTEIGLTDSGTMVGTPTFMSPEQARGKNLDSRTDLFSLGVVLYRLCTGRLPFDGPNAMAVLMALGSDEPTPVRDVNPAIPEPLAVLIRDLMSKNPATRPSTASGVIDRICAIGSGRPQLYKNLPNKKRIGVATAIAAVIAMVAFGIIIIIKNKDGSEIKIDVPNGASVTVQDKDGKTYVESAKFTSWKKEVSAMDVAGQQEAVRAQLKLLNPRFNQLSIVYRVENSAIVGMDIEDASELTDLSPLRALPELKDVHIHGRFRNPTDIGPLRGLKLTKVQFNGCPLTDLSPLAGMPLTIANFWGNVTADFSPLKGMKLKEINVGHGPTKDLSVFKGMPLENVCLNISHIEDLSPLSGAPLKKLAAEYIKVTDLTPLKKMPLEVLHLKGTPIKDYSILRTLPLQVLSLNDPQRHLDILRAIPTLKTINDKPAAEILDANN